MKFTINAAALAAHIPGKSGKAVTPARVRFMLANPDKGANRPRLIAALIELGLNPEAAERFVDSKK